MKQGVLNIKVDYKPLDTYKNVTVRSGSNRQNYNANTRYFEPDRRIDPYVVLVECGVNDVHNIVSGLVNANLTDVSWKQLTPAGYKDILNTDKEFKIGTGADKGKITIFKNVSDIEPVTILFTARFMDNTTKRVVNFQESFNLITLPVAESPVLLETSAPVGYNLFPTENNQGLICQADLYRGKDKVPAAYWWYSNGVLIQSSGGFEGYYTNKLFAKASRIVKEGLIVSVEVADCSEYLNGLIMDKVDKDPEVIQWRELYQMNGENYYTKSNDWIKAWITTTPQISSANDSALFAIPIPKGKESWTISGNASGSSILRSGYIKNSVIIGSEVFESNRNTSFPRVIEVSDDATYIVVQVAQSYADILKETLKLERGKISTPWSPSKQDLQNLINQKIECYKSNTSLPPNYRPSRNSSLKLYKSDFMLMKKLPGYTEEILYPTSVSPEASSVQVEMVLNTNNGVIQQPEQFLSVGWLKQANGTFKYKGFKVNISIADIKALNEANKQLDYELREDLTLKP
ncbi:hypothetical protein [Myroides odoratus]|uniref:hypothetical protein n=1 Tax=Myroides odoratus TaxID=256 RepID=UPI000765BD84|nr:hypothetical protein [Myroides odoratus]